MKVLVSGSRNLSIPIDKYMPPDTTEIISGGAFGIDRCAEEYAKKHNIPIKIIRPDYKTHGKFAPLVRNREMVDMADLVIAIWDGKSRGTKFTIDYAIKTNTRLKIYNG